MVTFIWIIVDFGVPLVSQSYSGIRSQKWCFHGVPCVFPFWAGAIDSIDISAVKNCWQALERNLEVKKTSSL